MTWYLVDRGALSVDSTVASRGFLILHSDSITRSAEPGLIEKKGQRSPAKQQTDPIGLA